MSLSTLQAQLAALNDGVGAGGASSSASAAAAVGSTVASNRRHDEAVGRGLSFSVQHGQSVPNDNFRASFVFATARQAADVPARTLQAAAVESLELLLSMSSQSYSNIPLLQELAHEWSQQQHHETNMEESATATATATATTTRQKLPDILPVVSSILSECDETTNSAFTDCLNILEYLLRRYNLHVTAGVDLLWALLPVSDRFPALLNRALQLVDWTDSVEKQSYLWVRPYCVSVETVQDNATAIPVPPRSLLAKQCVKHVDILRCICRLARRWADLHEQECENNPDVNNDNDNNNPTMVLPRRGLAHGLSFTAAVIVEGLSHLQSSQSPDAAREAVLRTLLPHVVAAVSSTNNNSFYNPDWTNWGYIVASTLAETLPLAPATTSVLCNKILQGCSSTMSGVDDDRQAQEDSFLLLERQADAVACVLSILLPSRRQATTITTVNEDYYLELLNDRWLGCSLPSNTADGGGNTYQALLQLQSALPAILGYLYAERHVVVAPLVATLIVQALQQSHVGTDESDDQSKKTNKEKKRKKQKKRTSSDRGNISLVTALLQESNLKQLWKDPRTDLIASLASFVVGKAVNENTTSTTVKDDSNDHAKGHASLRAILETLHAQDPVACERGIAAGIQKAAAAAAAAMAVGEDDDNDKMQVEGDDSDDNDDSRVDSTLMTTTTLTETLRPLLECIVPLGKGANLVESTDKLNNANNNLLLPPRVALEHADPEVRLDAIQRLIDSSRDQEEDDEDNAHIAASMTPTTTVDQALWMSLLRRWCSDNDTRVALSACEALCTWFEQGQVVALQEVDAAIAVTELALAACRRWTAKTTSNINISNGSADGNEELFVCTLRTVAHTAREMGRLGKPQAVELWVQCLTVIVPFLSDTYESVVDEAARCVMLALDQEQPQKQQQTKKKKTFTVAAAAELLLESAPFIAGLQKLFGKLRNRAADKTNDRDFADATSCRRTVVFVMNALRDAMSEESEHSETLAEYALALGLLVVETPSSEASSAFKFTPEECETVKNCLQRSVEKRFVPAHEVPTILLSLASAPSRILWLHVGDPVVQSMVKVTQGRHTQGKLSPLAVLLETALRPNVDTRVVKRLLERARAVAGTASERCAAPWLALVPALSLLESTTDQELRATVVDLLQRIGQLLPAPNKKKKGGALDWSCLKTICQRVTGMENSAKMGGDAFLANFLSACIKESATDMVSSIQEVLLSLCVFSACGCGDESTAKVADAVQQGWVSLGTALGGCRAASIVLSAMELAGEDAFPLQVRWKFGGQPLLSSFLSKVNTTGSGDLAALVKCIGLMLKGVTLADPRIVIHSGSKAGRGGRSRSYSVGKMEGINYLTPYPSEMRKSIVDILSKKGKGTGPSLLASYICDEILKSKSWCEYVFKNLPKAAKKEIASAALDYVSSDEVNAPEDILLGLPLSSTEIAQLMKTSVAKSDLTDESALIEYVSVNAATLAKDPDAVALASLMFEHLVIFSTNPGDEEKDARDFVVHSIIDTLSKMFVQLSTSNADLNVANKKLEIWTNTLLALLGSEDASQGQQLTTFRSRSACLSLVVALCSCFPNEIIAALVPAMMTAITPLEEAQSSGRNARDTFAKLVPTFLKIGAGTGLSLTKLLGPFVTAVTKLPDQNDRERMYLDLADSTTPDPSLDHASKELPIQNACAGAILSFYLANEASGGISDGEMEVSDEAVGFAIELLESSSDLAQVTSLLLVLSYAKELLSLFQEDPMETDDDREEGALLPTPDEVGAFAATGTFDSNAAPTMKKCLDNVNGRKRTRAVIHAILRAFSDGLMLNSVKKFIKRGDAVVSRLSLQLWQDLLIVHSALQVPVASEYVDDGSEMFQAAALNIANESREYLQGILPAHTFLASVSSLIKDGGTNEIRSRSLRLVADRITALDPRSPEATLFEDLLPIALEFLEIDKKNEGAVFDDNLLVVQSALVAIEHIARAFAARKTEGADPHSILGFKHFVSALQSATQIMLLCESQISTKDHINAVHDLASSLILCAATLIRVVGTPCLPNLPKLMKPMLSILSATNARLSASSKIDEDALTRWRITQLSIMRALVAVLETVPQFVPPFLSDLFSSVTLSKTLRESHDDSAISVSNITQRFDAALATRVAPRLLIPAAAKALTVCTLPDEMRVLLAILKSSTEQASSSNVGTQKAALLNSVTQALEFDGPWDERAPLMDDACDLLDAVVLKLSEVQLRRVFDSMIKWRGELDPSAPEQAAQRRTAFWTMTERLSKELRSLFLPCLSVVTDDMISELKLAVAIMGGKQQSTKNPEGTKKRKLSSSIADNVDQKYSPEVMRILHPLLSTLEHSLRADAYQGGRWIRADDNRKYEDLLEPLGKLLRARVPADFPLSKQATDDNDEDEEEAAAATTTDAFASVVVDGLNGGGEGSVVGCLAALGAAGGNEQLWKPLNHAVLKACGDESRSEVRRAGLVCLLELMKSLGEEYMVLLPENLPVLAELLEDSNEEVASLAKEVVTLAEELIGESLEDSLR